MLCSKRWNSTRPRRSLDRGRILTDLSGPFFTVVTEAEAPSLADFERVMAEMFSQPEFGQWFARMHSLVESGRREFYNVEA